MLQSNPDILIRFDSDPIDGTTWDDNGAGSNWGRTHNFSVNVSPQKYSTTIQRIGTSKTYSLEFTIGVSVIDSNTVDLSVSKVSDLLFPNLLATQLLILQIRGLEGPNAQKVYRHQNQVIVLNTACFQQL